MTWELVTIILGIVWAFVFVFSVSVLSNTKKKSPDTDAD